MIFIAAANYMFKYDSTHGIYGRVRIKSRKVTLVVSVHSIRSFSEKDPASIPWEVNVGVIALD